MRSAVLSRAVRSKNSHPPFHRRLWLSHGVLRVTGNRILRHRRKGRVRLNDGERKALADIGTLCA